MSGDEKPATLADAAVSRGAIKVTARCGKCSWTRSYSFLAVTPVDAALAQFAEAHGAARGDPGDEFKPHALSPRVLELTTEWRPLIRNVP